jgi:mannitol-specific phosphotransferase system IIBC component
MVMPNIAAFIAWGLITAFFIPNRINPGLGDTVDKGGLNLLALSRPNDR